MFMIMVMCQVYTRVYANPKTCVFKPVYFFHVKMSMLYVHAAYVSRRKSVHKEELGGAWQFAGRKEVMLSRRLKECIVAEDLIGAGSSFKIFGYVTPRAQLDVLILVDGTTSGSEAKE